VHITEALYCKSIGVPTVHARHSDEKGRRKVTATFLVEQRRVVAAPRDL
jgi:hypothetical protein